MILTLTYGEGHHFMQKTGPDSTAIVIDSVTVLLGQRKMVKLATTYMQAAKLMKQS